MCASRSVDAALRIVKIGVVLHHAGIDLEVSDAAGERIGDGLEDERRDGLGIGDLALDLLAVRLCP